MIAIQRHGRSCQLTRPSDGAAQRALYVEFERHSKEAGQDYERFFHLMRKYTTTLPNTYGEPGVSLFEQWKMIAAPVGISDDCEPAADANWDWWAVTFPASSARSTRSPPRARQKPCAGAVSVHPTAWTGVGREAAG